MSWLHHCVSQIYRRKRKWLPQVSFSARSPAAARLKSWMLDWLETDACAVRGHRMVVDAIDSLQLRKRGYYDLYQSRLFEKLIQPGQVIVDAGANIGYFTLLFARAVGPNGHVHAFEPNPDNFRVLKRNIELNGYHNITPVQAVVGDRSGTAQLFLCENNAGDHRAYDPGEGRRSVSVPQVAFDEYFAGRNVDFIKADIQGYEYRMLLGMETLLRRSSKLGLDLEWWPQGVAQAGGDCRSYYQLLENCGFKIYDVKCQEERLVPATIEELLHNYGSAGLPVGDILALKGMEPPNLKV